MTGWLQLSNEQRVQTIQQASVVSGIIPEAIEKDWWVTLTLKALFNCPMAEYFLFKGGTSLSKSWKLLPRFSEDIDIALDPQAFGKAYIEKPTGMYVKNLKRDGCEYTSTVILEAVTKSFEALGVPAGTLTIEAEEVSPGRRDKDPQSLFVNYPSLFSSHAYLASVVKIEFSVRSLKEPYAPALIESILHASFPNPAYAEIPFPVRSVEPRKTFLEKVLLLHEKFASDKLIKLQGDRMSRHLYDLVTMMESPVMEEALKDQNLFERLLTHRQFYIRVANYPAINHRTLAFVPPARLLEAYRTDYELMRRDMIYETAPTFDELLQKLKWLNGMFNTVQEFYILEQVVAIAQKRLTESLETFPDQQDNFVTTILNLEDPVGIEASKNDSMHCVITLERRKKEWVFAKVEVHK